MAERTIVFSRPATVDRSCALHSACLVMIGAVIAVCPASGVENTISRRTYDADGVSLTCEFAQSRDKLRLHYIVSEHSTADVYVFDNPDLDFPYVFWGGGATAYIIEGISPVPRHEILVRLIPSASKISPGERIERTLEMTLPLIEHGAYDRIDADDANHDKVSVNDVRLVVQYLRSTAQGFRIELHGAGYRVWSKNTVGQVENLECRQHVDELILLKSRDMSFGRWDVQR
jgi:hypothetical protein